MTGDLDIVPDTNVRLLHSKGPKYREPKSMDWTKAQVSIETAIKDFTDTWCEKNNKKPKLSFRLGTVLEVMQLVNDRISYLQTKEFIIPNEVLQSYPSEGCLKDLQSKFVIAPIDKATGNVAFICKRFYATILNRIWAHWE